MIPLTLAEIAQATRGRLTGAADPATLVDAAVVIDSRAVVPGSLFVAIAGERVDGHDYAAAAISRGAVAVLAGRDVDAPAVLVPDTVRALGDLAGTVRRRLPDLRVVAVTGSTGKTSTKDLLAHLLGSHRATVAAQNSFNNEIGVPLTALRCRPDTAFLVSELGARQEGNIAYLCDIVAPTVGVVLNVGAAHAGVFGTRQATALTKGELVESLPADGLAILNGDDPLVAAMAARTRAVVWLTGCGPSADIRATGVRLDGAARARFTLHTPDGAAPVTLALHGEHHVANALAAAAAALGLGMDLAEVAELLGTATAVSTGRMSLTRRPDGLTVIDDAYNANPDSVAAALRALVAIEAPPGSPLGPDANRPGRRWAVLGEMLELGPDWRAEHERIGALAAELGVDHLLAVGPGARAYRAEHWAADVEAALTLLREQAGPADLVLVKASRAIGLDRLVRALLASDGRPGQDDPGAGGHPAPRSPGEVRA